MSDALAGQLPNAVPDTEREPLLADLPGFLRGIAESVRAQLAA